MSAYKEHVAKFKQLVETLEDHPNGGILQTIRDTWREFGSTHISVQPIIQGSKLLLVLANVLEENRNIWVNDFPKWVSGLMDCIVDYSGIENLFPADDFRSLVQALKRYIMSECWASIYCMRRLAAFPYVKRLLLPENDLFNFLKTKALSNNNTLTLLHNVTFGVDDWQLKLLEDKSLLRDLLTLTSSDPDAWVVFYNLAKHPDAKTLLPPEVLKAAIHSTYVHCIDISILLCNDDDLKDINLSEAWITKTLTILASLVQNGTGKYNGLNHNILDIVLPLANLSVLDSLKEPLGNQAIPLLLCVVTDELLDVSLITPFVTRARQEAARALWNFAYNESNRNIIARSNGVERLKQIIDASNPILKRNIEGILYMFAPASSAPASAASPSGHIMISYNWGNQQTVKRIARSLQEKGYNIWIDIEQMEGSTLEASILSQPVAEAIEKADLVLMCVSQKYKDSPNCRLEGEYCVSRKVNFIPLMMQSGYRADGWLGITMGSKLWYDFSDEMDWDSKITGLVKVIGNHGKGSSAPPVVVANGNHVKPQKTIKRISEWTLEEIYRWMEVENIGHLKEAFKQHKVDGPALAELKRLHTLKPTFFLHTCQILGISEYGEMLHLSAAINKL